VDLHLLEAPGQGPVPAVGDRVYTSGSLTGTYAETALCPVGHVHPLPAATTFAAGAALGVPYATAYRALFQRGQARTGELVLVHGASGGVGLAAVQFAVAAGLTVHGTAGSAAGRDLVVAQGAAKVADHSAPGYAAKLLALTGGRGYDVIVVDRMLPRRDGLAIVEDMRQRGDMVLAVTESLADRPQQLARSLAKIDEFQRSENREEDAPRLRTILNASRQGPE